MRVFLLLLAILPVVAMSQVNRSASELARDNAREYILTKIFKNQPYTPVSYGELKTYTGKNHTIAWTIEHKFEITEIADPDNKNKIQKSYKFDFYLDKKMAVVGAYSAFLEER